MNFLNGRYTIERAVIAETTAASNEIVAAVTDKEIVVINYALVVAGGAAIIWKSDTTAISGTMTFDANGGISCPDSGAGWFKTARGEALNLDCDSAVVQGGHLTYIEF